MVAHLQVKGGDLRRALSLSEAPTQQRRAPRRRRVAPRVSDEPPQFVDERDRCLPELGVRAAGVVGEGDGEGRRRCPQSRVVLGELCAEGKEPVDLR